MKSRTHLTLFVLLLLCLPSDCFGQTIHIHFGDKKTKKTSSRRAVPEPAVTATKRKEFSAEPELASPLALPAFTSPTSFTSLAPKNADVLLAMRPQRMLEYTPLHSKLSEAATIAGQAGLDAMNFNEIDLIMKANHWRITWKKASQL